MKPSQKSQIARFLRLAWIIILEILTYIPPVTILRHPWPRTIFLILRWLHIKTLMKQVRGGYHRGRPFLKMFDRDALWTWWVGFKCRHSLCSLHCRRPSRKCRDDRFNSCMVLDWIAIPNRVNRPFGPCEVVLFCELYHHPGLRLFHLVGHPTKNRCIIAGETQQKKPLE